MKHSLTTIDVFKLLNKSNCQDCNEKTCMAFAASVFKGQKQLHACPHLDKEILRKYEGKKPLENDQEEVLNRLKKRLAQTDFISAAERTGGTYRKDKLTIKIFGKDFSVHPDGRFESDLHINSWVTVPVLSYILSCAGETISNQWVPFKELKKGRDWQGLFNQQCEKRFKKVADTYTELFADLIDIFNGKKVENHYESDIALVLHPLPKLPMLLCYWEPEDELDSEFNLFFDVTADKNSNVESIYLLGTGIVKMFEKLALTHG